MRVRVTDPIKDAEGKPIETQEGPLSFRAVFNHTLSSTKQSLPSVTPAGRCSRMVGSPGEILPAEKKSKLFGLNLKLYKSSEIELTSDEAALIKERVDAVYTSPLIYGRVCELLDK